MRFVLTLAMLLLITAAGLPAAADCIWVDGSNGLDTNPGTQAEPVRTINTGISLASAGGCVTVLPGVYPENVVVNKWVWIEGAGSGSDPGSDTIIQPVSGNGINITAGGPNDADRLLIKDLRVTAPAHGIYTASTVGNITLDGVACAGCGNNGIEIHNSAAVTDLEMNNCLLTGNGSGMRVRGSLIGLSAADCGFDGNNFGLYSVVSSGDGTTFSDVTISGCTFDNNASKGIYVEKLSNAVLEQSAVRGSGTVATYPAGIDINLKYGVYQDITLEGVDVINCGTGSPYGIGIAIKGRDDAPNYNTNPATLTNIEVVCGTVSGCPIGIMVENNVGGAVIANENIAGNSVAGVANLATSPVDASGNWWGAADGPGPYGPGSGDRITENVAFEPWLDSPASCTGENILYIAAASGDVYLKPGETIDIELRQSDLDTPVAGFQAFLSFNPAELGLAAEDIVLPDDLFNGAVLLKSVDGGSVGLAKGMIPHETVQSAGTLATMQFTAGPGDYVTRVVFEEDASPRVTRYTDEQGDPVVPEKLDGPNIYVDGTVPVITCPADVSAGTDAGTCSALLDPGVATATDGLSGVASITGTRSDLLDLVNDPYPAGTTTITWTATDLAGNTATCEQTVTVTDDEAPTITCPGNITVHAEAGQCSAAVSISSATATDNCDGSPAISWARSDALTLSDAFPIGITTITWTATDSDGNSADCEQTVTVADTAILKVSVRLANTDGPAEGFTRCIEFTVGGTGGEVPPFATSADVAFDSAGNSGIIELEVPACVNGQPIVWTCMTAKDPKHTLTRQVAVSLSGTEFSALFTGFYSLTGGDLTNDNMIDILDYGVFAGQYGQNKGADTVCGYEGRHADPSGNGLVGTEDFTFIFNGFLSIGQGPCGGVSLASASRPRAWATVAEFEALGLGDASAADVNKNGVLDIGDLRTFLKAKRSR